MQYGGIDSKFRYVIVTALRAKELLRGAKPKIKSKSKNLIRVAEEEVQKSLIEYKKIELSHEKTPESESELFIGEKLAREIAEGVAQVEAKTRARLKAESEEAKAAGLEPVEAGAAAAPKKAKKKPKSKEAKALAEAIKAAKEEKKEEKHKHEEAEKPAKKK